MNGQFRSPDIFRCRLHEDRVRQRRLSRPARGKRVLCPDSMLGLVTRAGVRVGVGLPLKLNADKALGLRIPIVLCNGCAP